MTYLCTWPACKTAGCVDCNEAVSFEHRQDDDEDDECQRCHGDGMDPWNDYALPCPECGGRE